MLDPSRYFDHAATTPLDPKVLAEMMPYLGTPGNAGSIHAFGRRAQAAVETARDRVAEAIGAEDPQQVVFTAGATEACNAILAQYSEGWISPFEHAAVREPARARGYRTLPNEGLELGEGDGAGLLAVMAVNNEIGTRWDARDLSAPLRFVDATQALGKIPLDLEGVDYAAFSAHKLYGPQGVGALFTADGALTPWLLGGEQEEGRRAGTVNVAGAVGFGAACALAMDRLDADVTHAAELRGIVLEGLSGLGDWRVNGGNAAVPHILSVSFLGLEGETMVVEADARGFALSAGAACSSRSTEPSHVLAALGISDAWRRGTVRISFGRGNTRESSADLANSLVRIAENLRTIA
jgi:cysteine desulfurase